ncbi:glycosyltransferase [Pseudomonas sp. HLMP]|uniref:glycosyltransferase n=1 Tax=Pseudomonas sp. HLMP TaxID=3153767 RepID=UPI003967C65E
MRVACIVPTYNGVSDFSRLLDSLEEQSYRFDLYVVDSSSSDGTKELAESRVENLLVIKSSEFNHGGTRQRMVTRLADYDVYVFLTQDAYLEDPDAIRNIVSPFVDSSVGAVCGRQLPHHDANLLAQHARLFNYPPESVLKSLSDAPRLGIKTPFMSNSFSAYRAQALLDAGGFPDHVILSEDMYVGAKMLQAGWKIYYAGDAVCRHSHNYTIREEFSRYFDQGVFHARECWISAAFGGASGEGLRFVKSELEFLGWKRVYYWPVAIFRNAVKLLGFKLGKNEGKFPVALSRKLSMHKRYWDGSHSKGF